MTTTYDPKDPVYDDEADVRGELTRVFDVCNGCRRCLNLCTSFPTLFEMLDQFGDNDAGRLTPSQQDQVIDGCFQCKLCHLNCPYTPELHEWAVDFPRLMLRAGAMRHATKQEPVRVRLTDAVLGRTDRLGRIGTTAAPLANRVAQAKPGSVLRKLVERTAGISSVRLLAPFTRQRFSTWFKARPKVRIQRRQGTVAVFPTCLVEYQRPAIGRDLVKVYERNGIECELVTGEGCCGAPWLQSGDVKHFTKLAKANVKALAAEVRAGRDIVVPQPTCGYVLKNDYADYVDGEDAALVAAHTFDASEYLMKVHLGAGTVLDTDFGGEIPESIAYHVPCHLEAQNVGLKSRDLMKLTGSRIKLVQQCSAMSGMWGLRAENAGISVPMAAELAARIGDADCTIVAGDCGLANTTILEQTGSAPLHPLQVIARAYGIADEVNP